MWALEAVAQMCSVKKLFLEFTKFTGKNLCQSLFFNKIAGLRPATLLKKRLWHRCFPVNFVKFLRTPFHIEHLWWLLLNQVLVSWKQLDFCKSIRSSVLSKPSNASSCSVCSTVLVFWWYLTDIPVIHDSCLFSLKMIDN